MKKKSFSLFLIIVLTVIIIFLLNYLYSSNNLPAKPILAYPDNGSTNMPVSVTLKWFNGNSKTDNITYTVMMGKSVDDMSEKASGISNTSYIGNDLKTHTKYYWQVIACDKHGGKSKSDIYSFTTKDNPPNKPVLESPKNNTGNIGKSVILKWNPSTDPDGDKVTYKVMVGLSSNGLVEKASNFKNTSYTLNNLKVHTKYYWQIIANDGYGKESKSTIYSFDTKNSLPIKATLMLPENKAVISSKSVTLKWNPSTDPDGDLVKYTVLFGISPSNLNEKVKNIYSTLYTINNLKTNTTYYWKIISDDGYGGKTESNIYSFTVNNPPAKPVLTYPSNGTKNMALYLTLKWNPSIDPDGDSVTYIVMLGKSVGSLSKIASDIQNNFYTVKNLNVHSKYYWQVIACDKHGGKSKSDIYSFTTKDNPPSKPVLESPKNNTGNIGKSVILKWNPSTDPDGDKVTYKVMVGLSSNGLVEKITDLASTFYTIKNIKGNRTYYWQIIADDGHGGKAISDVYSFSTKNNPPNKPILLYPTNKATNLLSSKIILRWKRSFDYDGDDINYTITLGDSPKKLRKSGKVFGTSFPVKGLKGNRTYYWQIIADDGHGGKAISDVYSFSTKNNPPKSPILLKPTNNTTGISNSSITLNWMSSTDPDGDNVSYDFLFGKSKDHLSVVGNTSNTYYKVNNLNVVHTTYYWQVIAIDSHGSESKSKIYSFTTKDNSPTIPTLIYPPNRITGIASSSVILRWNPSVDPDGDRITYIIMLGKSPKNLYEKASNINKSSYKIKIYAHTTYYWQIIADDGYGGRTKSDVYSFSTKNNPPSSAKLSFPTDKSTSVNPESVLLRWKPSRDPDGDSIRYTILFGQSKDELSAKATGISETYYKIKNLNVIHTTYYWQIIADDGHGGKAISDVYSFSTKDRKPYKFSLLYPKNGQNIYQKYIYLTWDLSYDPDGDEVNYTILTGSSPNNLRKKAIGIKDSYYLINDLKSGYYYWQIIADDGHGGRTKSDIWYFKAIPNKNH